MKILIVDDIEDNREALQTLVGRYSKNYNHTCDVVQAKNGQEAVDICAQEPIDLIFMDIVMPIMDGLEATQLIKNISPSPMIIVISSENDEDMKSKILKEGAEDYIIKPFSSAIMLSRLNNYEKLIAARHSIGFQTQAINAFTHNVYSYHTRFFIHNEDELAQFWETLLVRLDYQQHIEGLSDYVRFFYDLGSYQIQKKYKFNIFLEEDSRYFYLSMDNMNLLPREKIENGMLKYCQERSFEVKEDILSLALSRNMDSFNIDKSISKSTEKKAVETKIEEKTVVDSTPTPDSVAPKEEELQTFALLDMDSLIEFENILAKLQTELSLMGSSSLELDDLETIHEYVKQVVAMLSVCPQAEVITESLRGFSFLLEDYSDAFLEKSADLAQMVNSFIRDIVTWKEKIFYKGAPSVDFLDDSISSSVQMIRAVFVDDTSGDETLDDIFDF